MFPKEAAQTLYTIDYQCQNDSCCYILPDTPCTPEMTEPSPHACKAYDLKLEACKPTSSKRVANINNSIEAATGGKIKESTKPINRRSREQYPRSGFHSTVSNLCLTGFLVIASLPTRRRTRGYSRENVLQSKA